MLKFKLNKEEYDALSDEVKAFYKGDGAGYILDVDQQSDDTTALRAAHERVKAERATAIEEARQLRVANQEREATEQQRIRDGILAGGNVAEIRAALEQEREQLRNDKDTTIANKDAVIGRLLVDDRATNMAVKLAGKHAMLLLPHIKARLKVDFTGDEPRTVVVSETGLPSTLSIADLEKEFLINPLFASILVGVDSSGGGTGRTAGGDASKKPSDYTEAEKVVLYNSNPAEFHRIFPSK